MSDELEDTFQPEEDEEIVVLTDEDGQETPFIVLDRISYHERSYAVLCEPDDEESVLIFREEPVEDGSTDFLPVEDEDEEQEIFDLFRIAFEDYDFCDAE